MPSAPPRIRLLPEALVNRIAAGEVIERPASVVKELCENAFDAGVGRLHIHIEDAGLRRIEVQDDGCGIAAADLPLAVARHATSKLTDDETIFHVATMGFRGEALSSIAAVSRLSLTSRPAEPPEAPAVRMVIEAGRESEPVIVGAPRGTRVVVENLFFNTPARAKFLKSPAAELARILDTVTKLAIPRPGVGFEVRVQGGEGLILEPASGARARLGQLYGRALAEGLIPLEHEVEGLRLSVLAAPPGLARGLADRILFFVNERPVRDKALHRAATEAYRDFLEPRRYPQVFVFLELDHDRVDVNVHPTKAEVRFADDRLLYQRLYELLRAGVGAPRGAAASLCVRKGTQPLRIAGSALVLQQPLVSEIHEAPTLGVRDGARPPDPHSLTDLAQGRVVQFHRRYIFWEVEGGVLVLDPHALHERVLLERLRAARRGGPLLRQGLLVPEPVDLAPERRALAAASRRELGELGLELSLEGQRAQVLALPALLDRAPPADLLEEALEAIASGGDAARLQDAVLARLACRAAVKFGDELPEEEMRELLRLRDLTPGSFACAHGRPTAFFLSLDELDRRFGRH